MDTEPLTSVEAADLLAPWGASGPMALAVSGGPDSMALAWAAKTSGLKAAALIVDHALRPESAAEARAVYERLTAMGVEAEILRWEHDAVTSRIHVEARKARYRLLTEACRRRGVDTLLLAHHRDDQAETILMRLAKGSGLAGLAGMAAESLVDGLRLVRPFLSVPKARLLATCETNGIPFVTDPSNASENYARGRLRRVSAALAEEGLTVERLIDLGERAGEAAEAIDLMAKTFMREHAVLSAGGVVDIAPETLAALPCAVGLRALDLALRTLRPGPYAPERAGLLGLWRCLTEDGEAAATLHGVEIRKGEKHLRLVRELAAVREVMSLAPGETVVWDGRWRVTLAAGQEGGILKALGVQPQDVLDRIDSGFRHIVSTGRARASCPALWQGENLVALPCVKTQGSCGFLAEHLVPLWLQ